LRQTDRQGERKTRQAGRHSTETETERAFCACKRDMVHHCYVIEHVCVIWQVSVAVLIDKFVSASALIKYEANEKALNERKKKEVRYNIM
jgi:hypothetical protein